MVGGRDGEGARTKNLAGGREFEVTPLIAAKRNAPFESGTLRELGSPESSAAKNSTAERSSDERIAAQRIQTQRNVAVRSTA